MRVIDFADVKNPKKWRAAGGKFRSIATEVAIPTEEGGGFTMAGRYLHDLQVIDGLAYLAYWRDGIVILDVGNGIKGGSPEHPQLVSSYRFNYDELYGSGWVAGAHAVYRYKIISSLATRYFRRVQSHFQGSHSRSRHRARPGYQRH